MNKLKYSVGDKIKVSTNFTILRNLIGKEGKIIRLEPTQKCPYIVKFDDPNYLYEVEFKEEELDYIYPSLNQTNFIVPISIPTAPVFVPFVDDKLSFTNIGKFKEEPKHICSFKTYTGLMYKEEFCEGCGIIKNKRGIYE